MKVIKISSEQTTALNQLNMAKNNLQRQFNNEKAILEQKYLQQIANYDIQINALIKEIDAMSMAEQANIQKAQAVPPQQAQPVVPAQQNAAQAIQ